MRQIVKLTLFCLALSPLLFAATSPGIIDAGVRSGRVSIQPCGCGATG